MSGYVAWMRTPLGRMVRSKKVRSACASDARASLQNHTQIKQKYNRNPAPFELA
jgi:hypothetical protein